MTSADEINAQTLRTIAIAFDEFHKEGAWPTYQYVDACLRRQEGVGLRSVLKVISSQLLNQPYGEQDNVRVTVRGLAAYPAAAGELTLFLAGLTWLVKRREAFRPHPTTYEELQLTAEEFQHEAFPVDAQPTPRDLRVVYQLLQGEPLGLGGGWSGDPSAWKLTVPVGILEYAGVEAIEDYLARSSEGRIDAVVPNMGDEQFPVRATDFEVEPETYGDDRSGMKPWDPEKIR